MREELKPFLNKVIEVEGTFSKYGYKSSFNGNYIRTVLLLDLITTDGIKLTDHMWFVDLHGFDKLGELRYGDQIRFKALCQGYAKGYGCSREFGNPREWDYNLLYPSDITLVWRK